MRRATTNGFARTGRLLTGRIRQAAEARGFAQTKLLTHWAEIAGADVAAISRPVDVTYGRQGMGATLTLLTTGAQAPMLQMQIETLREKVNAIYGYNAISRIRITQTAATGFAEGQVAFQNAPARSETAGPTLDPEVETAAKNAASQIENEDLRRAVARLGGFILNKAKSGK